jgi:hypothetical protein
MLEDIRAVLVESHVRDRHADLVQQGGPAQQLRLPGRCRGHRVPEQGVGQSGDARRVLAVDMVALQEVLDSELPRIPVYRPAKQIVEHPQP